MVNEGKKQERAFDYEEKISDDYKISEEAQVNA